MSEVGRRGNGPIWNYFDKIDDESKEAQCKLCHNVYNYKTTSHNLKNHLKHKHSDIYLELSSETMVVEKKIPKKSEGGTSVWAFYEPLDKELKVASCNECKKSISYKTTIANLKSHIRRAHQALAAELEGGCEETYLEDVDGEC